MNAPGPIAQLAASDAVANVGVHEEGGDNHGKYVETYLRAVGLKPGDPWCAAFVRYRLEQAAKRLGASLPPGFPDSGYCPDYQAWGKAQNLWIPKTNFGLPCKGDLILFYFAAKGRVAHMGIVVGAAERGVVKTVEGNTGDGRGVVREGDGVYERVRRASELGVGGGFVRLPF